ncbi:DUF1963 domain-containing protein [Streptomyces sp. NRRL F-4474]|uniref:DUF1963 domain-containing protein n=1 Tax=Streptomyces sp. NRRL F-4474 TaxID=1463851 RepID=UPI000B1D9FAD|nr:YwqG family protein [Streptomyces sp. NRRL F-4474]
MPTSDAPNVRAAFGEVGNSLAWRRHPVNARPFDSGHRLGGHPVPVQEPVEWEITRGVLGPDAAGQDSRLDDEAAAWVLLAQIDTDAAAGMMWGDAGTVYWLIRPDDLAAGRFEEAVFTWQCC